MDHSLNPEAGGGGSSSLRAATGSLHDRVAAAVPPRTPRPHYGYGLRDDGHEGWRAWADISEESQHCNACTSYCEVGPRPHCVRGSQITYNAQDCFWIRRTTELEYYFLSIRVARTGMSSITKPIRREISPSSKSRSPRT